MKFSRKFIVVITFVFFGVEASTEKYTEVAVDVDSKEEQAIIGSLPSELNADIEKKDVNDSLDIETNKAENFKEETEDGVEKDVDEKIKKNTDNHGKKSHEGVENVKEKQYHLFKDGPDKRHEPGFDLTPAEKEKFKIWKGGMIPYYIDVVSFSDKVLRDKIRNYLQMVNSASGLNFVELPCPPSDDNERWVFFVNRRGLLGCADHSVKNFTIQGVQQVVLGYDCMETRGEIADAVMSIAGIPAQHNAPDRDKYIQVNMENILPDKKYLFEKLNDDEWLFHDLEYDFNSITHYDLFKYSANGRPTIQLKNEYTDLGLAKELTFNDLLKIKMLYNYITKKNKLQSSQCEKLFKPRKSAGFIPHIANIKPRDKPSRYLDTSDSHLSMSGKPNLSKNLQQPLKYEDKRKNEKNRKKPIYYKSSGGFKQKDKPGHNVGKIQALTILSDYHSE